MGDKIANAVWGFVIAVTGATIGFFAVNADSIVKNAFTIPINLLGILIYVFGTLSLAFYIWVVVAICAAIPFLVSYTIAARFGITHVAYFLVFGALAGILPLLIFSGSFSRSSTLGQFPLEASSTLR